jgi:N-acetylglutamate synthase-like GNAT family acetyltransferase
MLKSYNIGNEGSPVVSFRPASADDEEFLYGVYATTRSEEMKLVPWNEAQQEAFLRAQFIAQQEHYRGYYPQARHLVILRDGQAVGRIYVNQAEGEIKILDVTLLPEHRGAGIGTPLIKQILDEASASASSVAIYVETLSPAMHLFERLGFSVVDDDGINTLLRWSPAA